MIVSNERESLSYMGKIFRNFGLRVLYGMVGGNLGHKFYFVSLSTNPRVSESAEVSTSNNWKISICLL